MNIATVNGKKNNRLDGFRAIKFRDVAKFSHYWILLILIIVLSFSSPNFFTYNNLVNVFRQSSLLLIMGLGMACAMLVGKGVDMSLGAILSISSCIAADFLRASRGSGTIVFGIFLAILVGALAGLLNGALIAYLRLPGILVTFGVREILRGIVYFYMDGGVVVNLHKSINFLGTGRLFGEIPMPIVIASSLVIVTYIFLNHTRLGRQLYITGANPVTAKFSGIKEERMVIYGFMLSGIFAAICGIVYIGRLGTAEAEIGKEFAFQAVSAAAIGGVSFKGGVAKVGGIVSGAIILTLLINGLNLLNISSSWQGFVNGVIIIVAVLIDFYVNKQTS